MINDDDESSLRGSLNSTLTSMRKKAKDLAHIPSHKSQLNLDPTTNDNVQAYVWKQLVYRLKNASLSPVTPTTSAPQREQTKGLTHEKTHGKNMRRLVKLVHLAVLNPCE